MRGDETELPVAASAELHSSDRKSSTLGPRQPANKCKQMQGLKQQAIYTYTYAKHALDIHIHTIHVSVYVYIDMRACVCVVYM